MRRVVTRVAVASFALFTLHAEAIAEPTADELETRAKELRDRVGGDGFTVIVEAPFVVLGNESAGAVKSHATNFLRHYISLMEKDYFPSRPDKLIEVWLFKNEKSYRAGANKYFGDTPDTPFGYYSPEHSAMIMNADGLGTLSHELVHPYIEKNFPSAPSWFNEGLASLYEYPGDKNGHIIGHVNWRLPNLKKEIKDGTLPEMSKLLGTSSDEFYNASYDAYAYARYLMYYLQQQDKLRDYYAKFHADTKDLTGKAALEDVLGEKLDTFEPKWRKWVLALQPDT
jgi:hypothetical protein|nr:DUF1570 domain-containing protein [Kofleriaceae bacterium]